MKQRDLPRVRRAAPLVVDEAVIGRAPRHNQPADRQIRIADLVGGLKRGSGLRDAECLAAEQPLQPFSDTERQAADGRDNPKSVLPEVDPQRPDNSTEDADWLAATRPDHKVRPIVQRRRV